MATKAKKGASKTAGASAKVAGLVAGAAADDEVQVCLMMALAGGTKAATYVQAGYLYDETQAGVGYTKCVRLTGLDDTRLGRNAQGHWRLRDWISDVVEVYVYRAEGAAQVDVGGEYIGLTSATIETETKGLKAIANQSVPPVSVAALMAAGLA